jgi:hypothetical protein
MGAAPVCQRADKKDESRLGFSSHLAECAIEKLKGYMQ